MENRIQRRKRKKNKVRKIVRRTILLLLILFVIYIGYDMYKENSIRLEEGNPDYAATLTKSENKEKKKIEVNIAKKYKGFKVDANLEIPKIKYKSPVLKEYITETMEIGPCKYWGPEPNEIGNYCIAAHNYEKKNMFNHIIDLSIGDNIYLLDNKYGKIAYTIYDIYKVKPENTKPISQKTANKREITLITCVNYSQNRLIIKAVEK